MPYLEFSEGKQTPEDLISQASSLLASRQRIDMDIHVASENGHYSTVVALVNRRERVNQLLKDVFAFGEGQFVPNNAQIQRKSGEAEGGEEKSIVQDTAGVAWSEKYLFVKSSKFDRSTAHKFSKQRQKKLQKKGRTRRPVSAIPRRQNDLHNRNQQNGSKVVSKDFLNRQKRMNGINIGAVAGTDGVMQNAVTRAVHAPAMRKDKGIKLVRKHPGPADYNTRTEIGKGGFSIKSTSGRTRVTLRTEGGPADYILSEKLGKRGLGFSCCGTNLRLWFYGGCWCLGQEKHIQRRATRALCALYTKSDGVPLRNTSGKWFAHKGRKKNKAFSDPCKNAEIFIPEPNLTIKTKLSKGPTTIRVCGIVGFHSHFNGKYMQDATVGKINGKPVFRRVAALDICKKGPGPGDYDPIKKPAKQGPSVVFASRGPNEVGFPSNSPGPAAYYTRDRPLPSNGSFFGVGPRSPSNRVITPGPGDYNIDITSRHSPAPTFNTGTLQREPSVDNGTPGPGHYLRHSY